MSRIHQLTQQHLTQRQRDVVLMRYVDGLTYDQIGYRLGITEATARGHEKAAWRRLKPHLQEAT